jgi:hypothetical protein
MSDPWDPFPFPTIGDFDEAKTYEGVGRVMDRWENLEFGLARIYSIFVNDPDGEALTAYGKGRIFRDRITELRKAGEAYFRSEPHQTHEGTFDAICAAAEGFAGRRNEVAHGVVFFVNNLPGIRKRFDLRDDRKQFLLIPPLFAHRNHGPDGLPSWGYAFEELWELMARMLDLSTTTTDYHRCLLGLPAKQHAP